MGCIFSRSEFEYDQKIFQVWNVDDNGRHVNPGKIEITETDLILHQKGKSPIRWPLKSLRRYGFDSELFSFESGRRCPTGAGIYAFRCRRAEVLFNVLQEYIQNTGGFGSLITSHGMDDQTSLSTIAASVTNNGNLPNGFITSTVEPTVNSSGYLEPIPINSFSSQRGISGTSVTSLPSIHSTPVEVPNIEGRRLTEPSPSLHSNCCCANSRNASPHYLNEEIFGIVRNGGVASSTGCSIHHYMNSSVMDESTSQKCHGQCPMDQSTNEGGQAPTSPSVMNNSCRGCCAVHCLNCVDVNTNYAKLDDLLKHSVKEQHYVNMKPDQSNGSGIVVDQCSTASCCLSRSATIPSSGSRYYVNINGSSPKEAKIGQSSKEVEEENGAQEEDADEDRRVNYIVLDLDNQTEGATVTSPVSPSSVGSLSTFPYRPSEGYATIDFDKTAALSISSNPCHHDDSVRKTRHSAPVPMS